MTLPPHSKGSSEPRAAAPLALATAATFTVVVEALCFALSSSAKTSIILLALVAVLGGTTGWALHHVDSSRPTGMHSPRVRPRLLALIVWLAGGTAAAALTTVLLLPDVYASGLGPTILFVGHLAAWATLPFAFALLSSARRSRRARRGSAIHRSDRRALVGTVLVLAAIPLTIVAVFIEPTQLVRAPWRLALPTLALPMLGAVLLASDILASRVGHRQLQRAAALDETSSDGAFLQEPGVHDIGIGEESYVVTSASTDYRHQPATTAVVCGTPELGVALLDKATTRACWHLVWLLVPFSACLARTPEPTWSDQQRRERPTWAPSAVTVIDEQPPLATCCFGCAPD